MQDRMKDRELDIRPACSHTSTISKHAHNNRHYPFWDEVKFIDRDLHWYTQRDSGIEFTLQFVMLKILTILFAARIELKNNRCLAPF